MLRVGDEKSKSFIEMNDGDMIKGRVSQMKVQSRRII